MAHTGCQVMDKQEPTLTDVVALVDNVDLTSQHCPCFLSSQLATHIRGEVLHAPSGHTLITAVLCYLSEAIEVPLLHCR